jgi:hypothetical protein
VLAVCGVSFGPFIAMGQMRQVGGWHGLRSRQRTCAPAPL